MPPFICLKSQVKDLADDCIKPAFTGTIIIIIIIMMMMIIIIIIIIIMMMMIIIIAITQANRIL